MNYKIGDTLVFIGNNVGDKHYDNFQIGNQYKIIEIGIKLFQPKCIN